MTASALYVGAVRHRRRGVQAGEFRHELSFAYLDLDELPGLLGGRLVRRAPGLVRVRRRDLLGGRADARPLRESLRALIGERSGRPAPDGPIRVLTTPRALGVCFNPVSLYYCFDASEELDAVVAEVTNTPWRQRHAYVLRRGAGERVLSGAHAKALHVSPFQSMDHEHVWRASTPGETLSVHIENRRASGAEPDFDATLSLRRRPLTAAGLRAPSGARALALIYLHAAALAIRRTPHFPLPAKAS